MPWRYAMSVCWSAVVAGGNVSRSVRATAPAEVSFTA